MSDNFAAGSTQVARQHVAAFLMIASMFCPTVLAHSEDVAVPEPEFHNFACGKTTLGERDMIDDARDNLYELVCEANLWLDGLLGGTGDINAARRTRGRLSFGLQHSEREGWSQTLRLRVRVNLPVLENRLSAFVGREPDADFVSGNSDSLALREQFPQLEDEDQWLAGLGYELPGSYRFRSSFRVGARRLTDPEIFARNRISWNAFNSKRHLLNFRAIPFWTSKDQFGLTLGADFAYVINPLTLLRWNVRGTQSGVTNEVSWRASTVLYRSIYSEVGLALEPYATGDTGDVEPLSEFGTRLLLRFPLAKNRIFILAATGPTWFQPPDNSAPRKSFYVTRITADMPFGF